MQTYEILVRERSVLPNSADMTLVRTSVGIDKVHVLFDNAEWLDFPISITFGNGDVVITDSLSTSAVTGSAEWVAEGECAIPWEVIEDLGQIRVTLQGTDSSGNHIITAYGAPLSVEEAGDVASGEHPEPVPTVDEWNQAYADAQIAINSLNSKLAEADAAIEQIESWEMPTATASTLGAVMPDGETITIDENGTISATGDVDVPIATTSLAGIVKPDGTTIAVNEFGTINVSQTLQDTIANKANKAEAIKSITRNGTTFTATRADNTTFTFTQQDTTYSDATQSTHGLMSTADKVKLDGVESGANNYELPEATTDELGGVKVDGSTIGVQDGVISVESVPVSLLDGVVDSANLPSYVDDVIETHYYDGAMYSDAEHTQAITPESGKIYVDVDSGDSYRWTGSVYARIATNDVATTSDNGLMSATDKSKLDGIESGAQVNPGDATQSASGLMSTADKTKLDTVEQGANNYALPTMSPSVKGGATAGDGLAVSGTALRATTRIETRQSGADTYQVLVID